MRIWDLSPGYLNRQSLLGEHRELHGIVSIIRHHKKGYSKHPETLRWVGYGWALKQRHRLLVAEMGLRGYNDYTPVLLRSNKGIWPDDYIDSPATQIAILKNKYRALEPGRIPLPKRTQELWAQHKYSVMARSISAYQDIGKWVATKTGTKEMASVALELLSILRTPPEPRLIDNALLHLWGYVSKYSTMRNMEIEKQSRQALLKHIQELSFAHNIRYLIESTAVSELTAWDISSRR